MTIKNVCVYCGSAGRIDDVYKKTAFDLGGWLATHGYNLVYGGARTGMMGPLADGALSAGGKVIGVITHYLKDREIAHEGVTEQVSLPSMHERKKVMAMRADAFIVMPGGIGTLDETFEIVTLRQIHLHEKPVVFFDINNFWEPLFTLVDHMAQHAFILPEHKELFQTVDNFDGIEAAFAAAPAPPVDPMKKWR